MKVKDVTGRRPDPELILKSLRVLVKIFDKLELKYWMETGNLLGVVRGGKLIPWDFDVDIGVQYSLKRTNVPSLVKAELDREGFKTSYLYYKEKGNVISKDFIMADKEGYSHIDIHLYCLPVAVNAISAFFYYLPSFVRKSIIKFAHMTYFSNEKLRPKNSYERDIKLVRTRLVQRMMPVFFCYKVKKIKFYDFEVKIPEKAEDYLYLNYGEDWRIPKEKFVTYIG